MPESPTLPLVAATIPADANSCQLKSLQDWANFFVKYIFVDGASINSLNSSLLFVGPDEPVGENLGKVWIKTSNTTDSPAGIGLYIGGTYIIIPIPQEDDDAIVIPPGIVVPTVGEDAPEGWATVTTAEAPSYGYDTASLAGNVKFIRKI